jgi:N4-gp56 family major capsid protein
MSDAMTVAGSLTRNQTMWDRAMYFGLRPQLHFDQFADVQPVNATPEQGGSAKFTLWTDMAVVSTALNESVDVDAVALADAQVTVTLAEYGNAANTTFKVRATSFIPLDKPIINLISYNAGLSVDTIERDVLKAGTNVRYATGGTTDPTARNTVEPGDTITSHDIRLVVTDLKAANVADFNGYYAGMLHPHVALDLREETGTAAWRDPHVYSDPANIYNGEIGEYEGVRWMVSSQAPIFADAGSSTTLTDVYRTMVWGRQALAKAYSSAEGHGPQPKVGFGPVVDKLERFRPVYWHWFGAYGIFRQAALRAIESSSSVGANS